MTEQSTARIALRLVIQTFIPERIREDSLALVDVLYEPIRKAEQYMGAPYPSAPPASAMPNPEPQADAQALQALASLRPEPIHPAPQTLPPERSPEGFIDSAWIPIFHSNGPTACHAVAYYLIEKISRRKKTSLTKMRLVQTGLPPRIGIDQEVCGTCRQEIQPFSQADVNLEPAFYTPIEERMLQAKVDPALDQKNRESRRWEVPQPPAGPELDPDLEGLIGIATTMTDPLEQVMLPKDPFSGLPPGDPTPTLDDLPDPFVSEPDIPAPTL
jgi:hypothetical protein